MRWHDYDVDSKRDDTLKLLIQDNAFAPLRDDENPHLWTREKYIVSFDNAHGMAMTVKQNVQVFKFFFVLKKDLREGTANALKIFSVKNTSHS